MSFSFADRILASRFAWHRQRCVASLVLAGDRQRRRRNDRDSSSFPGLNHWLGEWTYGRWIMVHMNLELYGWCSLPLVGFLFRVYGADRGPTAAWCRPVLVGVVRRARRGRIDLALGPLQRQAVSRLVRLRAHRVSRLPWVHSGFCCVSLHPQLERRGNANPGWCARKTAWPCASSCRSVRHLHRLQPRILSPGQSRYGRSHRHKPA